MITYPIKARSCTFIENVGSKVGLVGYCPVCSQMTYFKRFADNFRELGFCSKCGASNRKRQIAYLIKKVQQESQRPLRALKVFNCEINGALDLLFKGNESYITSEYFGEQHTSGDLVNGARHENLMKTSFASKSLDLIISSDVFEHIPDPYRAFNELRRILRIGGRHIFTVPYYQDCFRGEVRAKIKDGKTVNYMEAQYHLDPQNPEGILVYNIFSIEMLVKLEKLGFENNLYKLYSPTYGILGNNGVIFESIRRR